MPDFDSRVIRILVIDDNTSLVLPLLRSFSGYKQIHLDVLLCAENSKNYFRYSRYLENLFIVSHLDATNLVDTIRSVVHKYKSELIIPTREWISKLLFYQKSLLEEFITLHPMPDAATLAITENKWNLNKWLGTHGFPDAATADLLNGWHGDFPVLIKPVSGIGGEGIRVLKDALELEKILKAYIGKQSGFFLQEFLEGYDIDFSFFAVDGQIQYYTIQRGLISAHMEYSKGIEFIRNQDFYNLASSMISTLRYTGIGHLDFRFNSKTNQYVLIDFNSRYWSSVQGSRAMGVNFPYLAVMYALTGRIEKREYRTGHYYFSTTALKTKFKSLFGKTKYPVRLKDTQLYYLYNDPLPELMYMVGRLFKSIKRKQEGHEK